MFSIKCRCLLRLGSIVSNLHFFEPAAVMTGRMRDRHQDHSYTERYANTKKTLKNLLNHSQHTIHSSCISHTHLTYWSFKGKGKYLASDFWFAHQLRMSTALVVMLINKCTASVKYPRWCWLILKALCWLWGKCFRAQWWSRLLKPSSHRIQRSAHADSQPLKSPLWSPYWSCWIQTVTSLQPHHHLYACWGRYTTLSWATGVAT